MLHSGLNFKPNFTPPYTVGKVVVVALDELGQFLGYAIRSKYAPKPVPVDAVESFLEINKVDVELSLPLRALLNDVAQGEYLVNAAPFFAEEPDFLLLVCFEQLPLFVFDRTILVPQALSTHKFGDSEDLAWLPSLFFCFFSLSCQLLNMGTFICPCHPLHCTVCCSVLCLVPF